MGFWDQDAEFAGRLTDYTNKNQSSSSFPELKDTKTRMLVWQKIVTNLNNKLLSLTDHHGLLDGVRILSRDKCGLDDVVSPELIAMLKKFAMLEGDTCQDLDKIVKNMGTIVRAQKAMYNLIFNSPKARTLCISLGIPQAVMGRLRSEEFSELPEEIRIFDLKNLFLISTLQLEARETLRDEDAIPTMTRHLERLACESSSVSQSTQRITDSEADLILKIVFSITSTTHSLVKDAELCSLVSILRLILIQTLDPSSRQEDLKRRCIHVLTNIPPRLFNHLYIPNIKEEKTTNMKAIEAALQLLDDKLNCDLERSMEELGPILMFFCLICESHPPVRKYVRSIILPPLRTEVTERPEVGNALRNRLVKLMTSAMTRVAQLTAQFLFVLCKENVARLIKYTGYGNAAGLLAANGLMLGRPGNGEQYSDDSDSSDTDEYKTLETQVNPIIGSVEAEHTNPMAGMSEEQKEYEAVKLLNLMDRLQRQGIIQPTRIGEDGRPHPVDHILQLQDDLERPVQNGSELYNSESDDE